MDYADKSAKNDNNSELRQTEKGANQSSMHATGQKNKYINRIKSLTPIEAIITSRMEK